MAEISITKISSKGQIVIPKEMRENLEEGDRLVIIKNDNQLILKKVEDFDKNLRDDLEFAKRTEEAWKRHDSLDFRSLDSKAFIKELRKW
ncbi:AbrB/MazE/SpoVT family DNA-binding domain-containing protein [Candidatus Pacearchaeota archaeon]|nr:AbrB/MazE/SpoVT family DNA-binding domain-containing protein [Candidatus Pacearchaeota archaeon]